MRAKSVGRSALQAWDNVRVNLQHHGRAAVTENHCDGRRIVDGRKHRGCSVPQIVEPFGRKCQLYERVENAFVAAFDVSLCPNSSLDHVLVELTYHAATHGSTTCAKLNGSARPLPKVKAASVGQALRDAPFSLEREMATALAAVQKCITARDAANGSASDARSKRLALERENPVAAKLAEVKALVG